MKHQPHKSQLIYRMAPFNRQNIGMDIIDFGSILHLALDGMFSVVVMLFCHDIFMTPLLLHRRKVISFMKSVVAGKHKKEKDNA